MLSFWESRILNFNEIRSYFLSYIQNINRSTRKWQINFTREENLSKRMKIIRYSNFKGVDVFGVNLGDLMQSLSDSLLDSGYNDDYWWTRQRQETDDSLDALRQAILKALLEQEILTPQDVKQMLAENEGKFKGSLLEELIN